MQQINNDAVFRHARPEFILLGRDFCAGAVVRAENVGEAYCVWSAGDAAGRVRMEQSGEFLSDGVKYSLLSAVIPQDVFESTGGMRYFFEDAASGVKSEVYAVDTAAAGKLPPLIVSELYGRPKGLGVTSYVEIVNPTDEPVDIYDYKLMAFADDDISAEPKCSFNLSDERGAEIMPPRSVAVLWPQYPKNHNAEKSKYTTAEGFCEACMADFPKPEFELVPGEFRIIKLETCRLDPESGLYVFREGAAELPGKTERTTLLITPRDGGAQDAVFSMLYNEGHQCHRDTPVRHSSVWGIDVREPSRGISLYHKTRLTPGRLSYGQCIPDFAVAYPAILPEDAGKYQRSADGKLKIRFAVLSGKLCRAVVNLRRADGKLERFDAYETADGCFCASLPEYITDHLLKLEYFISVFDGVRWSDIGTASMPIVTHIIDDKGPTILSYMPTEKYAYDDTREPVISVKFTDASGVKLSKSILCIDKKNVSHEAEWNSEGVVYRPSKPLKYGAHEYEIMLVDKLGNKTYRRVEFSISHPDEVMLFRGEVHAHTADSDGIASLHEAMTYARHTGGADFFSVTDHTHYMDEYAYRSQLDEIDKYNEPGSFAALYGWEISLTNSGGIWGHMNILNSEWMLNKPRQYSARDIYDLLKKDRGAVGMFNHPGYAWGNFCEFSDYTPEAARGVCLAEIKGAGYDNEYMTLLARGWRAAPVFNGDNHAFDWITRSNSTGYVLAPALTRENILDAFRRRRTYSTSDSSMKIYYKINGEWMGAVLNNPKELNVEVMISTESEAGIGNISLMSEDNIVVASINPGALREFCWRLTLPAEFDYYYVKITSPGNYTVTSPVWVEGRDKINVKKITHEHIDDDYKPNRLTAKIRNDSDGTLRDVTADFYMSAASGFDIERTVPYASVRIPELEAGKIVGVSCKFPNLAGARRVSVIVRGRSRGQTYADTQMAMLSPIRIAEICTKTSEITDMDGNVIKNPFVYVKLCNTSNREIPLDGYCTRLWYSAGKTPSDNNTLKLDGYKIPAGGILTLWRKPPESSLTAEDFNRHYGIILAEGSELLISEIPFILSIDKAQRLEVVDGKEVLARIEYNQGRVTDRKATEDRAVVFDVGSDISVTSKPILFAAEPSPGNMA